MQTLNMDLNDAYKAIMAMYTAHFRMSNLVKQMRVQVNLVLRDQQDWQGLSAKDFYENYMSADEEFSTQLENYNKLEAALEAELDQWIKATGS
jgi:hypothetical protein